MTKTKMNIIGCGRLGKTIAKLLINTQEVTIVGVLNLSIESSEKAVEFIGGGEVVNKIEALPPADIYLIASPDDTIRCIAEHLAEKTNIPNKAIVIHCSGSLSSDVLLVLKKQGSSIASIHPLKSFAAPEQSIMTFSGTYCAIEGDQEAIVKIASIFEKIGAIVFTIDKENKKLYHAASVIANNYLLTLHYHAFEAYKKAGVDERIAKEIVSMLMNDALNNVATSTHHSALTGPIQRGDKETVKEQVACLKASALAIETQIIYKALGIGTLALTKHSNTIKKQFETILKDESDN